MTIKPFDDVAELIHHLVTYDTILFRRTYEMSWQHAEILMVHVEKRNIRQSMVRVDTHDGMGDTLWMTLGEVLGLFAKMID